MIVLEPDEVEHGIVLIAAQAPDNDQYYAMLDSGTNAIILPLQPGMQGEIAECQVPSATVTGPIVQTYEFEGARKKIGSCFAKLSYLSVAGMVDYDRRLDICFRSKARIEEQRL